MMLWIAPQRLLPQPYVSVSHQVLLQAIKSNSLQCLCYSVLQLCRAHRGWCHRKANPMLAHRSLIFSSYAKSPRFACPGLSCRLKPTFSIFTGIGILWILYSAMRSTFCPT
eukprot:4601622-Amphidinium_carterae.1